METTPVQPDKEYEQAAKVAGPNGSGAAVAFQRRDDEAVYDWLAGLRGQHNNIRVTLERREPKTYPDGTRAVGTLETFDEPIDDDLIREKHGGGKYLVRVQTPNPKSQNGWKYLTACQVEIAGPPKRPPEMGGTVTSAAAAAPAHVAEDPGLAKAALAMVEQQVTQAQRRAERIENEAKSRPGFDHEMFRALMEPITAQLAAAQRELTEMRKAALEQSTRPVAASTTDKLLEKMVGEDSGRIHALREQHASEIRQLREHHEEAMKRADDRHQRDLDRLEKAHERELSGGARTTDHEIATLKLAYESQIKSLERELEHSRTELKTAKVELVELRAKKETDVLDQIQKILALKEMMGELGGGKDEEGGVVQQILGALGPLAEGIGRRIGDAAPTPTPQALAAHAQRVAIQQRAAAAGKKRPQPSGEEAETGLVVAGKPALPAKKKPKIVVNLNPSEVKAAINYLEQAAVRDTPPAEFVASIRLIVPGDIIHAIREDGIAGFMAKYGPQDGVLTTIAGKQWLHKVADELLKVTDQK